MSVSFQRRIRLAFPILLLVASALLSSGIARAAELSALEVRVLGIRSSQGEIAFQLFDSKERFESRTEPTRSGFRAIENKACSWTMTDLPAGDYVLLLYHDRNGNRELDRKAFGIPKEPYGFSNNARGNFGPPSYEAIRFELEGTSMTIEIKLN